MNASSPASVLLVADVTSSVALHQRLDDQEAERAVERCNKRMTRAIEAWRGRILEELGDEVLACFDSIDDACQAAFEIQQRIGDLPPVCGHSLSVRVALHAGAPTDSAKRNELMRLAGFAAGGDILCTTAVARGLHGTHSSRLESFTVPASLATLAEYHGQLGQISKIRWCGSHAGATTPASPPVSHSIAPRHQPALRLWYKGKSLLVDERSPVLSLGRDAACHLIVEDRKVSRTHARIEYRNDGFHLVDTSTNGSFLSQQGQPEILVRRYAVPLNGRGQICLGSSINDPAAERLEYETQTG